MISTFECSRSGAWCPLLSHWPYISANAHPAREARRHFAVEEFAPARFADSLLRMIGRPQTEVESRVDPPCGDPGMRSISCQRGRDGVPWNRSNRPMHAAREGDGEALRKNRQPADSCEIAFGLRAYRISGLCPETRLQRQLVRTSDGDANLTFPLPRRARRPQSP